MLQMREASACGLLLKWYESLPPSIKESFKADNQMGSFKEVCNLCVEKATLFPFINVRGGSK